MAGNLTVFMGGMFSGKTTELQELFERFTRAKKSICFIKPLKDNRYSEEEVVNHKGEKIPCVNSASDKLTYDVFADVLLVDEIQFFEENVAKELSYLAENGKKVYVSGLDMDFEGKPFETSMVIMALADEVYKKNSICEVCGEKAVHTIKRETENKERIELGSDEAYMPVCRDCFKWSKRR